MLPSPKRGTESAALNEMTWFNTAHILDDPISVYLTLCNNVFL